MSSENKRLIVAGSLIFLVLLLQPFYYDWLGILPEEPPSKVEDRVKPVAIPETLEKPNTDSPKPKKRQPPEAASEQITINTPLYSAKISNRGGGSVVSLVLNELNDNNYKYLGGFNPFGEYVKDEPVVLFPVENNFCSPCLSSYSPKNQEYLLFNRAFSRISSGPNTYSINDTDSLTLLFEFIDDSGLKITKEIVFNGSSYEIDHHFYLENPSAFWGDSFEVRWQGGLSPTERVKLDDITYASATSGQSGETEDINQTGKEDNYKRQVLDGNTDWVSIRNKYFTAAIIAESPGTFASLDSHNGDFPNRDVTPVYSASIGFPSYVNSIKTRLYLGPLDLEQIQKTKTNLDDTMNFGFTLIRPIGKGVLWFLQFLQTSLKVNYGFILIIFALIVRIITGPLTKKSFESSQQMQKIQPLVKKIQKKLKDNPTKMNQEIMSLYKEKGVNPLGGCLPMLLQMPLLWALFVVFRSTIEFRGAPFLFWITDLSQPDIVFNLPFSVPLYGSHIAVLPVLMGLSIFLTQRMSMATMDSAQRPIMYIMNGFFILLFNQFPSGLNLYYTVYNILNYFQQRTIRAQNEGL